MEATPNKRKAESDNQRGGDSKRAKVGVQCNLIRLSSLGSRLRCSREEQCIANPKLREARKSGKCPGEAQKPDPSTPAIREYGLLAP
jgi:hypothetical protein